MTSGMSRITVVGPVRRVDLAVPSRAPLAEVLPDLVRLSGTPELELWPPAWAFGRLGEAPLDPERSLAEHGVFDGEVLYLTDVAAPVGPAVVDDLVQVVRDEVDRRGGQWSELAQRRLLGASAWAWLVAGAALLAVGLWVRDGPAATWAPGRAGAVAPAAGLAVGALLALAAALLGRRLSQPLPAKVVALAALPYAAVGGAGLAAEPGRGLGAAELAAAALGLAGGAVAAAAAVPALGLAMVGLAAGALLAAAAAGLVMAAGASPAQAAALLVVAWVGATVLLPALAARMVRLAALRDLPPDDAGGVVAAERGRVELGHRLLASLLAAGGASLAGGVAVLAFSRDGFARWLAVAVVVAIALRARLFRFTAEVLPLALAALAGVACMVAVLAAQALRGGPGAGAALALVLAVGAGLLAAGLALPGRTLPAQLSRNLDRLELVVNLLLLPLCAGVLGAYAAIEAWARGLR